ncbi:MAG: N-acetyltransferase [Rhodocyclaceae bacterium]|nr:N-acetyltransferase [Rhodocyclaceae bacterium]MBX3669748.1 N-acetyltransferase [Rhodocyclaceae bacterium]
MRRCALHSAIPVFQLTQLTSIEEIAAGQWDALAGTTPFLRHAFLAALERSGAASPATGWTACHPCLWQDGILVACAPLYQKQHGYGEFVFDWAWAEAWERAGGSYYPKLSCAIPFTPVSGPRLLARDADARSALLHLMLDFARARDVSSLHVLFPPAEFSAQYAAAGLMPRQGVQFHWHNRAYRDFEDFLDALTATRRKKIRQERRRVATAGVETRVLTGTEIGPAELDLIYRCYANTYHMRGRSPYLSRQFFDQLQQDMPSALMAVIAYRDQQPLACAFNLYDKERLYGRYWGEIEHVPLLHFECCYYAGIEWCIAHGLQVFEGGAQGEHKIARGFDPVLTHSAHWIADPRFASAVKQWLARESAATALYLKQLEERESFRPRQ